jgi:hypothetical protein
LHRAGWGLDEPCEEFLKDYYAAREVKHVKKASAPTLPKERLWGIKHMHLKDVEELISFE